MSSHGKCNGCGKGFKIFTKEEACKNCGLSFCSKCVSSKIAIPKLNGVVGHVCQRCYNIISGKIKDTSTGRDISPPANFLRNLQTAKHTQAATGGGGGGKKESLKKKGVTTDPVVKNSLKPEYRNLSKDDMEIAERLERLKKEHKELELGPSPLPPIQDVEQRLARLKGQPETADETQQTTTVNSNPVQQPTKQLTEHEQTNQLLQQITDEVGIDKKVSGDTGEQPATVDSGNSESAKAADNVDLEEMQALIAQAASELEIDAQKAVTDLKKDKEIMARLVELKARKMSKSEEDSADVSAAEKGTVPEGSSDEDSEDEETQVKTILQQALEEKLLDERLEASGGFKPPLRKELSTTLAPVEYEVDPDELPWCCICNEDATIRCLDCDLDLYCKRCYKDGHHQLYDDDHQSVPYKKKTSAGGDQL